MKFQWREGYQPPKRLVDNKEVVISADEVAEALEELEAPSPDNLLEASKVADHILHWELWHEGDQVWAQRARLDRCRHIIGAIHEVTVVGGREITVRAVEFVRVNGEGKWADIKTTISDPAMDDAYLAEITRLLEQASAKMTRYRELKAAGR